MELHGIKAMAIFGKHSPRQRAQTLLKFRESPQSEVLFMSNVGITGINLDCANIMIILVSSLSILIYTYNDLFMNKDVLWSKQDDMQLVGRVWRNPQAKQVYVYRLIAMDSPDELLSQLSFSKAVMHESFMGSDSGWSRFF
jgi:SNF2 family DNA or RNA helicase